jgi:hypothetical protein
MKRLLLATAAVIALAVAVPIATAQYTTPPPATAPYTTPIPDDPSTPQDESLRGTTTQPAPPPTSPETSTMPPPATAQTDPTAQTYDSTQAQADTTDTYATTSGMGENVATPASLEQHARDAGMDSLPMSPQEVCMPREISLTTSGVSLNRDREHQLINAADRASVCEFQRVVINSPSGRADEARQLLINSGVDAGMIEVVDADTAGLEVEMNFAGIATSSEQYAQMFSTQQLAGYQPSTAAPSYQPGTTYAPSTTAPDTTTPAPDTSFQTNPAPADTVPGRMDDLAQPSVPNPDPADNVVDETMDPTSGEPILQPELYDT